MADAQRVIRLIAALVFLAALLGFNPVNMVLLGLFLLALGLI